MQLHARASMQPACNCMHTRCMHAVAQAPRGGALPHLLDVQISVGRMADAELLPNVLLDELPNLGQRVLPTLEGVRRGSVSEA